MVVVGLESGLIAPSPSEEQLGRLDDHKPQEREVKCPYFRRFGDRKIVCEGAP